MAAKAKNMVSYIKSGFYVVAVLFSLLVIMGLDQCVFEGCDCEDAIQDLLDDKGEPIDFEIIESGVTNMHTYWYVDDLGITREYVFEWGEEDSEGNILKVCCKEAVTSLEEEEPEPDDPDDTTDTDDGTDDETDSEDGTDTV